MLRNKLTCVFMLLIYGLLMSTEAIICIQSLCQVNKDLGEDCLQHRPYFAFKCNYPFDACFKTLIFNATSEIEFDGPLFQVTRQCGENKANRPVNTCYQSRNSYACICNEDYCNAGVKLSNVSFQLIIMISMWVIMYVLLLIKY